MSSIRPFANKYIAPWRRFVARYIDGFIMGAIGFIAFALFPLWLGVKYLPLSEAKIAVTLYDALTKNYIFLTIFSVFTSILLNAVLLSATGTTIGKCLFGLRLRDKNEQCLTFLAALHREFMIYVKGMAFGIPIINLFSQGLSYTYLIKSGETSWDKKLNCNVIYKNDDVFFGEWIIFRCVGLLLFLLSLTVPFWAHQIG